MRITKLITKRENTLIFNQILSTILKRNVWRSDWRIWMWILGLKGLIHLQSISKLIATISILSYDRDLWQTSIHKLTRSCLLITVSAINFRLQLQVDGRLRRSLRWSYWSPRFKKK